MSDVGALVRVCVFMCVFGARASAPNAGEICCGSAMEMGKMEIGGVTQSNITAAEGEVRFFTVSLV